MTHAGGGDRRFPERLRDLDVGQSHLEPKDDGLTLFRTEPLESLLVPVQLILSDDLLQR